MYFNSKKIYTDRILSNYRPYKKGKNVLGLIFQNFEISAFVALLRCNNTAFLQEANDKNLYGQESYTFSQQCKAQARGVGRPACDTSASA